MGRDPHKDVVPPDRGGVRDLVLIRQVDTGRAAGRDVELPTEEGMGAFENRRGIAGPGLQGIVIEDAEVLRAKLEPPEFRMVAVVHENECALCARGRRRWQEDCHGHEHGAREG